VTHGLTTGVSVTDFFDFEEEKTIGVDAVVRAFDVQTQRCQELDSMTGDIAPIFCKSFSLRLPS
jgi:hypothetical protein